ncbi:MAG: acyltransferase [Bacteroidetes bacterium]|nr:acyltransferase [Bacteroidota bacterium]
METQNKISEKIQFHGLDHLRAVAIILVLIFHYTYFFEHPTWWPSFANFGWTGVDLFFVLSGFLITYPLLKKIKNGQKILYKHFFIKRTLRILPVYLVVVAIYSLFPILRERDTLPELWRYLTFTHNFGLDASITNAFSHAWSLCVEEHFYIFLPLTLIVLQNKKWFKYSYLIIVTLFIACFFLRKYFWVNGYLINLESNKNISLWTEHVYFPTYNRLDGLLVGVTVAGIYIFSPMLWNKLSKRGNLLVSIGCVILALCYFFCSDLATYETTFVGFPLISIGYGVLVMGAISPSSFLYRIKSSIMVFIAKLSYGIYLIHKIAIYVAQTVCSDLGLDPSSGLMVIISAISCLLMALVLYIVVEKPFMALRRKILKSENDNSLNLDVYT